MRFITLLMLLFVSTLAVADVATPEAPQAQLIAKGANYAFVFDDVEQNGAFESYVCNVIHADLGFRLNTITATPLGDDLFECLDQGVMHFGGQYRIDIEHRQWPSERLKTVYTFYATAEF